jgi:hypothetical protein
MRFDPMRDIICPPISQITQQDSQKTIKVKCFIGFFVAILSIYGLCAGYPFNVSSIYHNEILAFYRIAFASLLIFRLYRSLSALPMLWGYKCEKDLKIIWFGWMIISVCLLFGFLSFYAQLANFLLFLYVFKRSKYYSIEEIYFQINSLAIVFLPLSNMYSIDNILSISNLYTLSISNQVAILNMLAWLLAILLLSAAYEKASNKNWRRGLSFYYFIGNPHLLKPRFHWLRKRLWLCKIISYATVLGQGAIFIAYFIPGVREVFLIKQVGFGLLLFLIVDISFIGQLFSVQFLLLFMLTLYNHEEFAYLPDMWLLLTSSLILILAVLACFSNNRKLPRIISSLIKYTSGLVPIQVFSDKHLFGLYIYKISDANGDPYLETFNEKGEPGPYQHWYPRYYQGAMYPVTDACISKRYYPKKENTKEEQLLDLGAAAFKCTEQEQLIISVKAINPDEKYTPTTNHWIDSDWAAIYKLNKTKDIIHGEWIGEPPALKKITRVIN